MSTLKQLIDLHCPDGVRRVSLGSICSIDRGRGMTKKDLVDSGVPAVHYGQIYTYYGLTTAITESFVHPNLAPKLTAVDPGDVILASTSENMDDVGKALVWLGNKTMYTGLHTLVLKHEQNSRYMGYWLGTYDFYRQKRQVCYGAKVIELSAKALAGITIPLPPREVQDKIVDMLDTFAALCDNLDREIAQREQQFDLTRKQILGSIDSTYSTVTLGELADQAKTGATPKATNEKYYVDGTIPWLRTGEVRFNRISSTEVKVTELALSETAIKWVDAPSVVVAISGATAGKSAIIEKPMTTNQHCCCLHIDDSKADYGFVYHWTALHYEYLKSQGRGARGDLNTTIIKSLPVPVPPLDIQCDIADKLDAMQALIDNLKLEREQRGQQFDYYRSQLLTFPAKDTPTND